MAEPGPVARSPVTDLPAGGESELTLVDESLTPKWHLFTGPTEVVPGTSMRGGGRLIWSVSPLEWTVVGPRPEEEDSVDLTHVRAMFRLTGKEAPHVLAKICAIDFEDRMFPDGAAARTLVAAVPTEIVRDDRHGTRSYLILPSRSFGAYLHQTMVDAGVEFGLSALSARPNTQM